MPRGGVCAPGGDQEEGPSSGTGTSGRDAPSSRRWGGQELREGDLGIFLIGASPSLCALG